MNDVVDKDGKFVGVERESSAEPVCESAPEQQPQPGTAPDHSNA